MNAAKQIIAGVMIYFTVIGQVFGQAALLPNAEQQYFDNNGHPLASGTVTYYVPGTTTKKTTWTNSTQTINNTNPVTLDIGGKGIMYGQGSYRQVLQDNLGNVIWDQPTTAYGSSSPSGATGTDTAPVGSVLPYSGFVVPTNWQLAYGQALSRTTFAALEAAITISAPNVGCINTSTTLTGFTDTSIIRVGAPIEATCLPTSTTVASITNATTIVVSQAAASTLTVTATIFPWGNGDQVSTFNAPDLRGRSAVGADCMGYVASGNACGGNLTATYYGANPGAAGQTGGTQSKNLTIANINAFTPTGTISAVTPSGTISFGASTTDIQSTVNGGSAAFGTSSTIGSTANMAGALGATASFTGTPTTPTFTGASLGSGTAHSVVNPDATVNYIIKVTPNSTGAGGVVSFGGMIGDIVCDSTLTCAPIGTVNTVGCTTATLSQLGCVIPDGTTIAVSGSGVISLSGAFGVVGPGSSAVGDLALFNNTTGSLLKDGGGSLVNGIYSWSGNQYFGSGVPWVDVKSGTHSCAAATGNGTTDDTVAIQCQINWMNTNLGGGVIFFPNGNYLVSSPGLLVKGGTHLQGSGRFTTAITAKTDTTVVNFDAATCQIGAGASDLFFSGFQNAGAAQDNAVIGANCAVTLQRNYILGGHHGLNTAGNDGTYTDNYICGWTGDNVFSTGANWYFSDKLDACSNPSTANGFEQGTSSGVSENYFYRVDLSCGSCTDSIKINDGSGTKALTFFYGAITASPIVISNAIATSFIGGELDTISGAGLINITGAYASSTITPSGGTYSCAGNVNINCGPLPIAGGGTGGATATAAKTALGAASLTGGNSLSGTQTNAGQIVSTFGTPTIASGACGATTNGTISGTNQSGIITIGAATTTSCTVTFSATITAPNACLIFPGNTAAATTGTTVARVGVPSATAWVITGSALANTVYNYLCL